MRAPNRGLARSGLRSSTTWWRRGARPERPHARPGLLGRRSTRAVVNVAIDGAEGKRGAMRSAHVNSMNVAQNHAIHAALASDAPVTDCLFSASDSLLAANRAGGLARVAVHELISG